MRASLILTLVMGLIVGIALSACSSENPKVKLSSGKITTVLKSVFKREHKMPATDPSVGLSRESLKGITRPLMFAHLEKPSAYASLSLIGDSQNVKTFQTVDNVSLSVREGVVLASRGLAGDLISADVTGTVNAVKTATSSGYSRIMRWLDGEDQTVTLEFICSMRKTGAEKVVILGAGFSTIHLKEKCESGKTIYENDYWRALDSSLIWQSRQWLGPRNGYIDLQLWVK